MPIEVDPAFKKSGKASRARSNRRRNTRIAAIAGGSVFGVAVLGGLIAWLAFGGPSGEEPNGPAIASTGDPLDGADPVAGSDDELVFTQTAASAEAGVVAASAAFVDLRGDPMILRFDTGDASDAVTMAAPDALPTARLGATAVDQITVVQDALVVQEQQLVTTLPSSREDFAFFQAQRTQGLGEPPPAVEASEEEAEEGTEITVASEDGSWGEALGEDAADDDAVYIQTTIENNTSVVIILPDYQRREVYSDTVVVVQTERSLVDVLSTNGVPLDEAEWTITGLIRAGAENVTEEYLTALPPGSIVAIRTREDIDERDQISHITLYSSTEWVMSYARTGLRRFETAADPWNADNLVEQSGSIQLDVQAQQDIRLLDALYSAAIRNGLNTTLVGEMIVVMSQLYDLDSFAAEGDEVTILTATNPGPQGQGAGQVLFVGINGPSGEMECYVVPTETEGTFGCYDFSGSGSGAGAFGNGLVAPVNGTKTSDFGPRHHPILNQLRNHNGVDWAAPTGTPIVAAMAGTISRRGNGGGYGNVIYINHGNGIETRYAHLDSFGGFGQGDAVQQGQVIGFVGTTGRSTGPHLHFELRIGGNPVDPLSWRGGGGPTGGGGGSSAAGSQAVEALVNQIIQVESAGNARAANSRSTARGLGQFIESTWIRMMTDYRPDLVAELTRAELLELRFNPELSREMVRNLARENESYLRARGHSITAGRLYLAHFLGPGGANTALRAGPEQTVLEVMGQGVVNANPFLSGKNIAWLWDWADRKMRGSGSSAGSAPPPVAVVPQAVRDYRDGIDEVLASLEGEAAE